LREGNKYGVGKINVLELSGSYREMGRQYGRLFGDMIRGFYKTAIEGYFIKEARMPYLKLLAIAHLLFHRYPPGIKDIFKGMSEASGVGFSKIIMLDLINTFEFIRYQNVGRCSNVAVWGDHTEGGGLIFGRNYDEPRQFKRFNEFIVVAIFSPDSGVPTASIGYAGQIGVSSAINRHGVFIANNEAPTTRGEKININTPSVLVLELDFLTRSYNFGSLDKLIKSSKANCPIIVSAGDPHAAYVYEWSVSGIKRRAEHDDGVAVATNHFADPSWRGPAIAPDSYGMTLARRANLLSLVDKYKGRFNVDRMKEVLGLGLADGGAADADRTNFQIVVVPGALEAHLKIPDFQDWTEIDLRTPLTRQSSAGDAEFSVKKV
jgi:hypothetical protein